MMKYITKLASEMLPMDSCELLNYWKTCDYIPTTKEEIFERLSRTDFEYLMSYNMPFYNAAVVVLDEEIKAYIKWLCDAKVYRGRKEVKTLDDLLRHTRFYGYKYESSRMEFAHFLASHLGGRFEF